METMPKMRTPRQPNYEKPAGCRYGLSNCQLTQVDRINIANTLLKNKAPRRISHDRWRGAYRNKPSEEGVRLSRTFTRN